MKKLFRYLIPYKKTIVLATVLMLISVVCNLTLPTLMGRILDRGVYGEEGSYGQIVESCLWMLALAALSLGTVVGGYYFATKVTSGFMRDLRNGMCRKINEMSFEQAGKLGTAALTTRMTHDAGTLGWAAGLLCGSVIIIPLMFVGGVVLCLRKDVWLSLIMLAMVPLVFLMVVLLSKKLASLWEVSDKYTDVQSGVLRERIRGIRVIRAFCREKREQERFADATVVMTDNMIRANVTMELIAPVATVLMNLAVLGIVFCGAGQLERGTGLTAGDIFAVIQYVSIVLSSLISGMWAIIMLPHARVAARRVSEITETETVAETCDETVHFQGAIQLEHVSFRYEGADAPALNDVTLEIPAGAKVAIIGGTGSGKSTLISLLMAFRRPTAGTLRFDGMDAAALSGGTIRKNLSACLQTPMLYAGTIADNIRMGKLSATDAEVAEAAAIAQLSGLLSRREEGILHKLTTAGSNISGGQKQRVAIARAVVKDAPIYLFDDSFSALDFLTEKELRTALNERIAGRTQIIVSQRVTTAMRSDRIFVLDQGRLVGAGTHSELLQSCTIYREIYASQTGGGAA